MSNLGSAALENIADELKNIREILEKQSSTQMETQNSNLTFEKRTMRDCYNCKRYETEGECIECHYEPKDEPKPCEWCKFYDGENCFSQEPCKVMLYFKTEPQTERKCIDCKFLTYRFNKVWCDIKCDNPHDEVCDRYKLKDEPQTDCAWR